MKNNVNVRDTGRTLLWFDAEDDFNTTDTDRDYLSNITKSQCGTNLNQTESIRLESDLRGWFNVDQLSVTKRRPDITRRPSRVTRTRSSHSNAVGKVMRAPGSVYHMLLQDQAPHANALSFHNNYQKNYLIKSCGTVGIYKVYIVQCYILN